MRVKLALCAVGTSLALVGTVAAKPQSASKASKRVAKSMSKLKSYRVNTTIVGGMAQGEDHKITQARVNETYACDVVGNVAHVKGSSEAYRLRMGAEGKGAIRDGVNWKGILSTDAGKLVERLFQRPETHFAKIRQHAKLAKYLPRTDSPAAPGAAVDVADGEDAEGEGTRVKKGKKSKSKNKPAEVASNRIRIVAPTTEAINQFNIIVNSGCLGGG